MSGNSTLNVVVKDRLKRGQCIHCGIQTHELKKKSRLTLSKPERIPLTIPGQVEHGRCLQATCLQLNHSQSSSASMEAAAANNNKKKPNRFVNSQTVGAAAQVVGTAVGMVVGVPELGEAVGNMASVVSDSVSSSQSATPAMADSSTTSWMDGFGSHTSSMSSSGLGVSNSSVFGGMGSSGMNEYVELLKQQSAQYGAQSQQHMEQFLQAQDQVQQLLQTSAYNRASAQEQMKQMMQAKSYYHGAQAQQGLDQLMQQCNLAGALGTTGMTTMGGHTTFTNVVPQCPHGHRTTVTINAIAGTYCDDCTRAYGIGECMHLCAQCDWATCVGPCRGKDAAPRCPQGHGTTMTINTELGPHCDECARTYGVDEYMHLCAQCDWATCVGLCRGNDNAAPPRCPQGHTTTLTINTALGPYCDECTRAYGVDEYMHFCSQCDWATCVGPCRDKNGRAGERDAPFPHCPRGHRTTVVPNTSFGQYCDDCARQFRRDENLHLCALCDWATCIGPCQCK